MARSLCLALVLVAALPAAAQTADPALLNRVVIRINDRIATLHDYEVRRAEVEREVLRADLPLAQRRQLAGELPERVFADLYQELLLLSRADQLGVVASDEEVDAQLDRLQQSYGFADRQEFEAALAQSGVSTREFREQLRRNMRIQDVIGREVRGRITVDEELARKYYREHQAAFHLPQRMRLREIIVLEESSLSPAQRDELAAAIRAELVAGRAAEEVVAEHQETGATSAVVDLGWVGPGDLAPELESAVWNLQAGEVSPPVASRGGLHVLIVGERREAGLEPFNEVADRARELASQETFQARLAAYLEQLDEQAYVQLAPPPGAEGFQRTDPGEALEPIGTAPAGDTTGEVGSAVPASPAPVEPVEPVELVEPVEPDGSAGG
jgi:parvulin-like peptidyl-prolyl isomerase